MQLLVVFASALLLELFAFTSGQLGLRLVVAWRRLECLLVHFLHLAIRILDLDQMRHTTFSTTLFLLLLNIQSTTSRNQTLQPQTTLPRTFLLLLRPLLTRWHRHAVCATRVPCAHALLVLAIHPDS